ncbi:hypothetical protein GIB67_029593 [Kingdonia uniflora]|uniref:Serpin domain-containing protein n=1 Tax=Kingdonia uniflora TaxID=39325 RepID=A0A7J7LLP6_9MAGN|nr:hypothetical protein GIB67_029593 [Kingdonia uniflora]
MDLRESISKQTNFSLNLAKHVISSTEAKDSNLVFSPLSIHVVLSLIAAGSKGKTLEELHSLLGAKSNDDLKLFSSQIVELVFADASQSGGPRVGFSNGVWIEKSMPMKPSFKGIVEKDYKSAAKEVDFVAKAIDVSNEVNSWAEKETSGLIKEILPSGSVDSLTKLIFANALYFKGAWNEKFDGSKTKNYEFHLLNGTSVQVPFMTSQKKQLVSAFDGFKVLALPYKRGQDKRQFSMYFYLPDAKDGLPALVERVGTEQEFIDLHFPRENVKVGEFRIPKVKISFGFEASKVLKGLGVVSPFVEGDLTEMVDSSEGGQQLYVSNIFHKSFIEVNEEGTEAAAASAVVIKMRGLDVSCPVDFVADHPFMFVIREDMTGVVLFVGHVLNPV